MAASNGLFIETVHLFAARPHFQPPPREQQEEEQQQEEEEEEEEEDYCSSAHVDVSVTEAFSSCRFDGSKPSVGHFRSSSSSARPILMFVCFAFRFYVGLGAVSAIFFFFCLPFYLRLHPVLKGSGWDLLGCGFSGGSYGGILGVVVRF